MHVHIPICTYTQQHIYMSDCAHTCTYIHAQMQAHTCTLIQDERSNSCPTAFNIEVDKTDSFSAKEKDRRRVHLDQHF